MDKGPFSIYDFIGYALPGASMIFLFPDWYVKFLSLNIYKLIEGVTFVNTVAFIILSYVSGHIVNFISSLTIEVLAIWLYGYPSSYLLEEPKKGRYLKKKYMSGEKYFFKYFYRVALFIFLLPISLMSLCVGNALITSGLILKPMGNDYWETLKCQWKRFIDKGALNHLLDEHSPEKYHRIIFDYVYETSPIHAQKLDNYVALYGFLRTFALIMNLFTLKLVIDIPSFFTASIIEYLFPIIIASIISYIFFIAYLKFNRRYTLEAFMGLITNKNLHKK